MLQAALRDAESSRDGALGQLSNLEGRLREKTSEASTLSAALERSRIAYEDAREAGREAEEQLTSRGRVWRSWRSSSR